MHLGSLHKIYHKNKIKSSFLDEDLISKSECDCNVITLIADNRIFVFPQSKYNISELNFKGISWAGQFNGGSNRKVQVVPSYRPTPHFNLGGKMGEAKKCKTCDYFTGRWEYASVAHGVWDFKTCNETCPMVEDKQSIYNRIWQRAKYRRLHGLEATR